MRSDLDELFQNITEQADAITENLADEESIESLDPRVTDVTERYENTVHELQEVIKSLKIRVHKHELSLAKADSTAFDIIKFQEEKADKRHEQQLAAEKQRHDELLTV